MGSRSDFISYSFCSAACNLPCFPTKIQDDVEILELLDRQGRDGGRGWPRSQAAPFADTRSRAADALVGENTGNLISTAVLCTLPRLVAECFPGEGNDARSMFDPHQCPNPRPIFFFNEQHLCAAAPAPTASSSHKGSVAAASESVWKIDEDELPWHCMSTTTSVGTCGSSGVAAVASQPSFFSVWIVLRGRHMFIIADNEDANKGQCVELDAATPNRYLIISSRTPYTHRNTGCKTSQLVVFQYSATELKYGGGPLAFAVPCVVDSLQLGPDQQDGASTKNPLSLENGVIVFSHDEDPVGRTFNLRHPGDAVLVRGLAYHASRPGESDRLLLKLVVFFYLPGVGSKRECQGKWLSKPFTLSHAEMVDKSFREVSQNWDRRSCLGQLWAPYNQYRLVNMQLHDSNKVDQDQMQNVRRVSSGDQLERFLSSGLMKNTTALIGYVEGLLRAEVDPELKLYDMHFLRQIGPNAASFCKHQDIHDTGIAETSVVKAGMAILLGGWRV